MNYWPPDMIDMLVEHHELPKAMCASQDLCGCLIDKLNVFPNCWNSVGRIRRHGFH